MEEEDVEGNQCILSTFPRGEGMYSTHGIFLHHYQGFWYDSIGLKGVLALHGSDRGDLNLSSAHTLICSVPKSGCTWLKALAYAIVTRNRSKKIENNPLLTSLPHELVPFIEFDVLRNSSSRDHELPLLSTHIPFTSLPTSITGSDCKMVYICRGAKDVFISHWHFANELRPQDWIDPISIDHAFGAFCRGVSSFGPYWDHVLGYWKASLDQPDRVLFLTYEAMMKDPVSHVRSIAEFIGYPFSKEEEVEGVAMKMVEMCSFERLSNLEVNKSGITDSNARFTSNGAFFRKGKVGDWKNYLSEEMACKIDRISEDKFGPFGLKLS